MCSSSPSDSADSTGVPSAGSGVAVPMWSCGMAMGHPPNMTARSGAAQQFGAAWHSTTSWHNQGEVWCASSILHLLGQCCLPGHCLVVGLHCPPGIPNLAWQGSVLAQGTRSVQGARFVSHFFRALRGQPMPHPAPSPCHASRFSSASTSPK